MAFHCADVSASFHTTKWRKFCGVAVPVVRPWPTFTLPPMLTVLAVVRTAARIQGMRLTPGSTWSIQVNYQRGERSGADFQALDSGSVTLTISGAAPIARLEGIRDDVVGALRVGGATVTDIYLATPQEAGGAWQVRAQINGAASSRTQSILPVAAAAQVARLDTLLGDVLAALQSRGDVPAGTLVTL